ncbi:hypothetical protein [Maliponia aquimaris]|uniref:DUF1127 domain-containing protein n=1 Tax=Maliponia aquimaris TaxID=1673631 RepID=A0A238K4M1_9RHOB|nr:hypothetical protein [Maliponia aquimaris]SMX37850.1 hypothetical protein MAA8898_01283 [Maliponia aquimaris]
MANAQLTTAPRGIITGSITSFFQSVFNGLTSIAETNSRVKEVERLNALSDANLATKGLRREDIVRHVFRDVYYV